MMIDTFIRKGAILSKSLRGGVNLDFKIKGKKAHDVKSNVGGNIKGDST